MAPAQAAEAAKAATAAQVALRSQVGKQPASGPPQPARRATRGAVDPRVDEALRREQRAKNRFKVENLLDAASAASTLEASSWQRRASPPPGLSGGLSRPVAALCKATAWLVGGFEAARATVKEEGRCRGP